LKKSLLFVVLLGLFTAIGWAQTFSDDFTGLTTGSTLVGQSSWTKGSTGPEATVANTLPLTHTGYNSGGGEYVVMPAGTATTSRIYKGFTPITFASGSTIYYSVLLNLATTSATGTAYFMSFGSPGTGTNYAAKLFAITNGAGYNIGLSKTTNTAAFGTTVLSLNTTYLIVVRYTFHNLGIAHADSIDDEAYLWVNPAGAAEPSTGTAECSIASGTGGTDYDGFASPPTQVGNFVWHSRSVNNPTGSFDGIRLGYGTSSALAWTDLNPGVLPVEITSLTAVAQNVNAQLKWSTATEVNNFGFDIERRAVASDAWSKVGFVAGAGNSNVAHHYSYADNNLSAGKYAYRIKQIDNSGAFTYTASTEVTIVGMPKELKLYGNYPNPFNPSTKLQFTVAENGKVRLSVYNVLGQEVATLFNGEAEAGNLYTANFDASRMATGIYFSVLEYGNQRITHKMLMTK